MHKLIIIFVYLIFAQDSVFSATIIFDADEEIYFTAPSGTSYDLVTEHGSGGGDTVDDPTEVYVPIKVASGSQESHNVLLSDIPDIGDGTTITASQTFSFSVDIDLATGDDTPQYIYMAYYDSNEEDYTVFKILGEVSEDVESQFLSVDLSDLCTTTYDVKDCTDLAGENSSFEDDDLYYIFASSTSIALGDSSSDYPSTYSGGAFLQTNLSTRVYDGSDSSPTVTVSQTGIITGDESLYLTYDTSASFSDTKETLVFSFPSSQASSQTYSSAISASATLLSEEDEFAVNNDGAKIQVKNLTNNQLYNISVAFLDKYQFATNVTATEAGTPLEIAKFLNEQSCYLVSAGFGRPHYVLEYFRMIRDQYLLKTSLGRSFVNFYYGSAPKYAGVIYNNAFLSFIVRSASYVLYFFMNFFWAIAVSVVLLAYLYKFNLFNKMNNQ